MPTKEKTRDNCSTNNISCLSLAYILSLVLIYEKTSMLNLAELNVIANEWIYLPLGLKDNLVI